MKLISMVGIVLIILGAIALIYQGFNYNRQKTVLDIGAIHATEDVHHHVSVPPILGGLGVVGGIILVAMGAKQKTA
jgi:hypothetical protein